MMSEFGCMEDDWDLQAVVRGSCISSSSSEAFADIMENHPPTPSLFAPPFSCFGHQDEILMMNFPAYDDDFFEIRTPEFGDGLEGLYKPFYPTTTTTPTSISAPDDDHQEVKKEPENETKILHPSNSADDESKRTSPKSCTTSVDATTTQTPKSKRGRKNQHKRVVHQVAADGLSNDMWAWRKYGQKPIKGSPYPRSYYRCSSLKGCLARKQVERSSSDPSIFIITYTSEHSHAHPTRRSALAGSTRTKSSLPKQPGAASAATANGPKVPTVKDTLPSPKTPSMASLEDEVLQQVSIGNDQEVEQISESSQSGNTDNNVIVPDLIFPEELFPSFEDFQGLLFDQLLDNFAAY